MYDAGKPVRSTSLPIRFVVPVPAELANPITLELMAYPAPVPMKMPLCVLPIVLIQVAVWNNLLLCIVENEFPVALTLIPVLTRLALNESEISLLLTVLAR